MAGPRGSSEVLLFSGLQEHLTRQPGVCNVKVIHNDPVTQQQISVWEKAMGCTLPFDLQQFYMSHDGGLLSWQYLYNKCPIDLGRVNINSLSELSVFNPLRTVDTTHPSLLDLTESGISQRMMWSPSFTTECRVVSFDYSANCGHSCLVFRYTSPELSATFMGVWLLDLSLTFHKICNTFSDYIRLAIVHLGLLQWPYLLTSNLLSPTYLPWYELFIPKRLELDFLGEDNEEEKDENVFSDTKLEFKKLPQKVSKTVR